MDASFDLVVLGAGSGGLAAAKRAARHGARVAIVEGDRIGGTCVIRGCVPKKLLVYGAQAHHQLADAHAYGITIGSVQSNTSELFRRVRAEVDRLNQLHITFLDKAHVTRIEDGHGSPLPTRSACRSNGVQLPTRSWPRSGFWWRWGDGHPVRRSQGSSTPG